ncbi:DUF4278 domain-containing protein [Leptolyngbya sp. AN02str]|uniref:DUF4278 domain-containing protein n=1 Tax=Leptolyngbya sp. AN02str TaxID=3423363 RepID=UPI003D322DB1
MLSDVLEVGLVEGLIAVVFFGLCAIANWYFQRPYPSERELADILDRVDSPKRTIPDHLTYRGVAYTPNAPELEILQDEGMGHYRGTPVHSVQASTQDTPRVVVQLTYRGVPYVQRQSEPTAQSPSSDRTDS